MSFLQRWKAFSRRAAVVQSNVLLTLLYYVAIVPASLFVRRPSGFGQKRASAPGWSELPREDHDVDWARRQF